MNIRVILTGCVIGLLLSGCASNMPKEVDIPVAAKQPAPKIPPKPDLPIGKLDANSKPADVIRAYAGSLVIMQGFSDQLLKILNGYQA